MYDNIQAQGIANLQDLIKSHKKGYLSSCESFCFGNYLLLCVQYYLPLARIHSGSLSPSIYVLVAFAATYSNSEKDQLEAEVGLCVSTCSKQIDRLKNSAVAAQQSADGRPGISGQASAHLHGVVSPSQLLWIT